MYNRRLNADGLDTIGNYVDVNLNPFATGDIGMPNCTCYCYGRAGEILGRKPEGLCLNNAKDWFKKSINFDKGAEPKLGAIMCFTGKYGHVAVVEEIHENGDVVCSNSNWGMENHGDDGKFFFTTLHTKESGYNNYDINLKFQGFIYIYRGEDELDGLTPKPVPVPDPTPVPEPTPAPVDDGTRYLNLSPEADSWRVYPTSARPIAGNECFKLNPSLFNGLSYTIKGYPMENVALIETRDGGLVQIYINDPKATITTEPVYGLVR